MATRGAIQDQPASRDFAGFSDLGVTLTTILIGAPAMSREGFLALLVDPQPIPGVSLKALLERITGEHRKLFAEFRMT